jgi:hypothetical protein
MQSHIKSIDIEIFCIAQFHTFYAVIDPNKHLETALESHICMVDDSRYRVLDLIFQPKFL